MGATLFAAALAAAAVPHASSTQTLATVTKATPVAAWHNNQAWSTFANGSFALTLRVNRKLVSPQVATSSEPFDVSIGPDRTDHPLAVYARADKLYSYDLRTSKETALTAASKPAGAESWPSVDGDTLVFARGQRVVQTSLSKPSVQKVLWTGTRSGGEITGISAVGGQVGVTYDWEAPQGSVRSDLVLVGPKGGKVLREQRSGEAIHRFVSPTMTARYLYYAAVDSDGGGDGSVQRWDLKTSKRASKSLSIGSAVRDRTQMIVLATKEHDDRGNAVCDDVAPCQVVLRPAAP